MSKASEEAEYRYPDDLDLYSGSSTEEAETCRKLEIRAFEQGADWQAEQQPTEAEIDAAASEIEDIADLHHEQFDIDGALRSCKCGFECETVVEFDSHWYRSMANAALLAARKAVAE